MPLSDDDNTEERSRRAATIDRRRPSVDRCRLSISRDTKTSGVRNGPDAAQRRSNRNVGWSADRTDPV